MSLKSTNLIVISTDKNYISQVRSILTNNYIVFINKIILAEVLDKSINNCLIIIDLDTSSISKSEFNNMISVLNNRIILTGLVNPGFCKSTKCDYIYKDKDFSVEKQKRYRDELYIIMNKLILTIINEKKNLESKTSNNKEKIIAIASSTGGPDALESILKDVPQDSPPILIVQHMISGFTKLFAERLNTVCKIEVREAKDGEYLKKGLALIAPTDFHMIIKNSGAGLYVHCYKGVKLHGVMPSADILFNSVAEIQKSKAVGVILTGMGADGGQGLLKMRRLGARTIGQDKETCIVYGMPKFAKDLGAVEIELPLKDIARKMINYALE